jgi:hypothetical protein
MTDEQRLNLIQDYRLCIDYGAVEGWGIFENLVPGSEPIGEGDDLRTAIDLAGEELENRKGRKYAI